MPEKLLGGFATALFVFFAAAARARIVAAHFSSGAHRLWSFRLRRSGLILQLLLLASFHQLNSSLGYFSTPDLARMFHALTISSVIVAVVWLVWGAGWAPPRGVIALDWPFCSNQLGRMFSRSADTGLPALSP